MKTAKYNGEPPLGALAAEASGVVKSQWSSCWQQRCQSQAVGRSVSQGVRSAVGRSTWSSEKRPVGTRQSAHAGTPPIAAGGESARPVRSGGLPPVNMLRTVPTKMTGRVLAAQKRRLALPAGALRGSSWWFRCCELASRLQCPEPVRPVPAAGSSHVLQGIASLGGGLGGGAPRRPRRGGLHSGGGLGSRGTAGHQSGQRRSVVRHRVTPLHTLAPIRAQWEKGDHAWKQGTADAQTPAPDGSCTSQAAGSRTGWCGRV